MADLPNLDAKKPSAWAMADAKRAAERVVAAIEAECDKHGGLAPAYSVRLATPIIAAALEAVLPSAARSILANRQAEIAAARHEGRRERGAEIVAWLRLPCGRADHDDRWCPACNDRSKLADSIKRGAGRKDGAVPSTD